jgi:hypothetical protein
MEEKLVAYIEDSLSEEEKLIIEEQLKKSPEMRESLSDLRKTIQLAQSLEEVETPDRFTEKIISRVRKETAQKKGIFERLFSPFQIKLPLQAFAAIFLVAVFIFIYKAYKTEPDRIRSNQPGISTEKKPETEEVWGDIELIVNVEDFNRTSNEVQTALETVGGIVLRKQSFENKHILFVLLDTKQVNELIERLKPLGEVKKERDLSTVDGTVKVKIEIVNKQPSLKHK